MRLLHVRTLEVQNLRQIHIPPYAILSHTWGTQEMCLQDLKSGLPEYLRSSQKIADCCKRADSDGFDYVVSSW